MTTKALALPSPSDLSMELEELVEHARAYAADKRAASTRKAYLADFAGFEGWCARHGLPSMPATPAAVSVYVAALAKSGRKVATIERALAGIAHAHRSRGFEWLRGQPAIAAVMEGIRREHAGQPTAQKCPVGDEQLAALLGTLDGSLAGLRDRALLTMGWFGAFRRSELVALDVEDVTRSPEGLLVRVRRSKGDQKGKGATKGIAYASRLELCAIRALDAWLAATTIKVGPVFRRVNRHGQIGADRLNDRSVARIVQRSAVRAGLDASTLAAHSLRSGFCTTAARRGKSLDAIMRQTLHKSESVARGYIRHAKAFDDNATTDIL